MRWVARFLAVIAGAYLLIVAYIWYAQAKFLFHPNSLIDITPADRGVKFENVALDGLTGWWVPADDPNARTLLFFHGNAGNVAVNIDAVVRFRNVGLNVLIIDYSGYGKSTGGPPREKRCYEDADRAWKYLVSERNIPPAHIAIYGHSMGGAVAVDLASRHPEAGALITECTMTSIAEIADGIRWARLLPVRLILTERFDSSSKIGSVHPPKLFLQGEEDRMINRQMAQRLYTAAPEPKQLALIPKGGHEDSAEANPTAYFAALNGFLTQYGLKKGE